MKKGARINIAMGNAMTADITNLCASVSRLLIADLRIKVIRTTPNAQQAKAAEPSPQGVCPRKASGPVHAQALSS